MDSCNVTIPALRWPPHPFLDRRVRTLNKGQLPSNGERVAQLLDRSGPTPRHHLSGCMCELARCGASVAFGSDSAHSSQSLRFFVPETEEGTASALGNGWIAVSYRGEAGLALMHAFPRGRATRIDTLQSKARSGVIRRATSSM